MWKIHKNIQNCDTKFEPRMAKIVENYEYEIPLDDDGMLNAKS